MMARRKPQQLELSISLAESVTLREQLTRTQEELAQLREDAAQWAQHFTRVDRERHELLQERDTARAEVQDLQVQLQATRLLLDLQNDRVSTTPAALPSWLSQELRNLLALAHPDHWAQGQPATALAHEVAAAVNGLRQRLREGQR
jgi:hypothetical protein